MKIVKRTEIAWSEPVKNISKSHCDDCGERLWAGPGGMIYCDSDIKKHSIQIKTDAMYLVESK